MSAVLYTKTKTGAYDVSQLQNEINADRNITPSCIAITTEGETLHLSFAAGLSGAEDARLDLVIAEHTPVPATFNAGELPISTLDGFKLSVHQSTKPNIPGISTYAVWAGAGDDVDTGELGGGELLYFHVLHGTPTISKEIHFDFARHGRVWIHEGYLKFKDGGDGDYLNADVMAHPTPLSPVTIPEVIETLDLVISDDDWVTYVGPGNGTHAFAGTPVLVPRTFSKDGDWDYDGASLMPNVNGNGGYKISSIERIVHRYINRIPCYGDCPTYFSMTSEETTEVPQGYFIRVTCHNVSNTTWDASVLMELYRQRTHVP